MSNRVLFLFLFSIIFLSSADKLINHPESKKVYICDNASSKKYHLKSNCKGLEKCESELVKLTKEEAVEKRKTELCGDED